jgi:uncharacterized protein
MDAALAERTLTFSCAGERLIGIVAHTRGEPRLGVLVVVGGPQYRVGSHRQFVLLARCLASAGIAVMRFDHRGIGDSGGDPRSFEGITEDIAAAISAFAHECPTLQHVVLWGLCDAASASLLYWHETGDTRISGMALLNPWVRTEDTFARVQLKHYYAERVRAPEFWLKLAAGKIHWRRAVRSLAGILHASRATGRIGDATHAGFRSRMAAALRAFDGPIMVVTSDRDLTGQEFLECCGSDAQWRGLMQRANVSHVKIADADHTFSNAQWREQVEISTLDWLRRAYQRSFGSRGESSDPYR